MSEELPNSDLRFANDPSAYFSDPNHAQLLVAEALACQGTPFSEGACARGSGFDCVSFVEHCMAVAGLPQFRFPRAEFDYRPHVHNDKILDYLRGRYQLIGLDGQSSIEPQSADLAAIFAELNLEETLPAPDWPNDYETGLMVGDLLVMRGKVGIWHLPFMLDSRQFIHCAWPGGVTQPTDIMPPNYRTAVKAIFRASAVALHASV